VVSFSLSIEARQNGVVEGRPTFLAGDEQEFMSPFRVAVDGLWKDFQAEAPRLLPGASILAPESTTEGTPYADATWAPLDRNNIFPVRARSFVWPVAFRFADDDSDHRAKLNRAFPGEWLLWVEFHGAASDALTSGGSDFVRAPTRGRLTMRMTLVDPEGKTAWSREVQGLSELAVPRRAGRIDRERYPELFRSAFVDLTKGLR